MILPGATLGILGGGQLGRMFCIAAAEMGYRTVVLDPDPDSPAGGVAHEHICTAYDDAEGLRRLSERCAAITTEFENVPADSLAYLEAHNTVWPPSSAVAITSDRIREKSFLREHGLATAPFAPVTSADDIEAACAAAGFPAILKTARLGYDGKGQIGVASVDEARAAFDKLGGVDCVLEGRVRLAREVSVVMARNAAGDSVSFPVAENIHVNGILDTSIVPARIDDDLQQRARAMAAQVANGLDYVGVLAVEIFVTEDGELLVNEMAPRPHNSGHYTLDACVSTQFEQQVRSLCGLPLGSSDLLSPVVMINLLGDVWKPEPDFAAVFAEPRLKLHLYGKQEARVGRKMGHINCLGNTRDEALDLALRAKGILGIPEA